MRKLILISLVIFFAICSSAWGDDYYDKIRKLYTNELTKEYIDKILQDPNYKVILERDIFNNSSSPEGWKIINDSPSFKRKIVKRKEFKPIILKKAPGVCYKEDNCLSQEEIIEQEEIKEKQLFENAKLECEAIGYKKGTEKFGECVLDLTE